MLCRLGIVARHVLSFRVQTEPGTKAFRGNSEWQAHGAHSMEASEVRFPPFWATHLLSFLVLCGQPMKIYCLSLFLARVAVVTTATYHPKDSKRCHRVMLMSLPQLQNQCRQTLNHVILFRCEQTALGTHSTEPKFLLEMAF